MSEEEASEEEVEVQDLTNSDVTTKYKLAADIVNKTLTGIVGFCKPGQPVVKACALGDTLIERQCQTVFKSKKIEKGVAFPTCISVNEYVCHYSPLESESRTLEEGDIIKIDLGVHIDGYIAVAAHTMVVTGEDSPPKLKGKAADVILAAHTAAEAAVKLIKPGASNTVVTDMVKKVAECYGVNPVQGVLMHQMKSAKSMKYNLTVTPRFIIDGNQVVIGREETDQKVEAFEFEKSNVYTVDIVMSTGEGKPIIRDARTTVFKRAVDQSYNLRMKSSRYILREVNKRFPTLPFTIRVLDEKQSRLGVGECVKHDLLHSYPVLAERPGDAVAHFKYTVLLLPSGTAKITGLSLDLDNFESEKEPTEEIKAVLALSAKSKKKRKKKKKKPAEGGDAAEKAPADAPKPPQ